MKKVLKFLYTSIPFKAQLFTIVRKIFRPEEKLYKHLHFKGNFTVKVKEGVVFKMRHYGYQLENDIFWKGLTGRWEKRSIELWMKLSENAKVIVDIGANTGIYSLVSKSLNPSSRIIAFEPIKRVFEKLEFNMQLNNYEIESYLEAVSDKKGQAIFYDTIDEHPYTATLNLSKVDESYNRKVEVEITTIDDMIHDRKLDRIDLIKIDVEYHEPEVLRGFSLINKYHPSILIEILSDEMGKGVQEAIEGYGANYLYFDIDEEKGAIKVESMRKSSGMNYLICTESVANELGLL